MNDTEEIWEVDTEQKINYIQGNKEKDPTKFLDRKTNKQTKTPEASRNVIELLKYGKKRKTVNPQFSTQWKYLSKTKTKWTHFQMRKSRKILLLEDLHNKES